MKLFTVDDGQIKTFNQLGVATGLSVPTDVDSTDRRPVFDQYKRRMYIFNQFNQNLVVTEFGTVHVMGITPPPSPPGLTVGAGAFIQIGVITFGHREGGVLIHESNPSPPITRTGSLTRTWTLPTTASEERVNVVRGYVSVDGEDFRLAWERPLGTVTVVESVPTLALTEILSETRGKGPYAAYAAVYHNRMWTVNAANKTEIFFSAFDEMESTDPENFITTKDGDFVTGMKKFGDELMIFCKNATYVVTGWDEEDITIRKLKTAVGCISHWSIVEIYGNLWFLSQDGVYMFDGSFHWMMKDLATYFRDSYLAMKENYENSIAADDRFGHVYKLLIPEGNPDLSQGPFYYVGCYEYVDPQLDGSSAQPDWTFDIRNRADFTIGLLTDPNARRDEFYTGSCDGMIRKENVMSNANDDGDGYNKQLTVQFKHYQMDDPGGFPLDGKRFDKLWVYTQHANVDLITRVYARDEYAYQGTPQFTITFAASPGTPNKMVDPCKPQVVGRGITLMLFAIGPRAMSVAGFGGSYGVGSETRF